MVKQLYHGSKGGIVGAIAPIGRSVCDFGRGFYLGDESTQLMTLICHSRKEPWLYTCALELDGLKIHTFESRYEWALYVAFCRGKCEPFSGTPLYTHLATLAEGKDVLVGKIANDRMFMVLNDFFDGVITDKAMIASLEVLNLGMQYCLKTDTACAHVTILDQQRITAAACETLRLKSYNQRQRASELTAGIYRQYRRAGYFFDEFFEKFSEGELPCN